MVEIAVRYEGQLRCKAEHGPSHTTLFTDAPVDNHGKGESFSPTDLTAASLAACIMTILGIQAKGLGLDFRGLHVDVEKHMTAQPPRRIAKLEATIHMPAGIAEDLRDRLIRAANACPVKQSLHPDVEIALTWNW